MLLPSALPCDASHSSHSRLQQSLFSPPASPPAPSHSSFANLMTTCRSLQSLLSMPAPIVIDSRPAPYNNAQLPTPPLAHAAPPLKLRLRPRPQRREPVGPKKVTKRAAPRAANKKRRVADDDMDRCSSASDSGSESPSRCSMEQSEPSTPKRTRIAPEQMPLGLERSDFHNMHLRQGGHLLNEEDSDDEDWNAEDDRVLIEIVLEKLRLSKAEWQDCARNLGRDRHAVDRRWKTLLLNGDVGLKSRPGR
ncbi:hypothetical protein FVEN_g11888 [Fusarium venenatum]|uniref:Myb-like domain-containing protein n=1 Tax=Fusarium venenatum TaxID=56646 RepID=A0A2L2TI17_9HYPO|nr:uncharacterized protein FVRRES_01563 [Fusarium venenatum]KAG8349947.1 hypothetical protein FVEN_g11888 [Fusarium venenatum]KAH7005270.1 hypothetical protein EDB82DRAFT_77113 [Fusarium venenatum]CEI65051.1 unnamed protein product [Fusarium venenatum]